MKNFNVTFKPDGKRVSVGAGTTVLQAANQAGIILNTVCGGKGICGKCRVILERNNRQVLACQYIIQADLVVKVPVESRLYEQKILEYGIDTLAHIHPTIHEQYRDRDSTDIFGLAVDIGTTTVVAKLINMTDGQCLATKAALNPQNRYGDDVISRIAYAGTDEKLEELQTIIIYCINDLIAKLCKQASVNAMEIYEMCVVGNTTMNHLFLKLPVEQLGWAPYKAFSLDAQDVPAERLAIKINPAGNIHTVENIAGFVGSDTLAVALATGMDSADEVTLAIDIGTNGEIILFADGKLWAASCAAGPAFEGARISCGSRAVEGAIETVVLNGEEICLGVIGNGSAHSICGSGLIDAVAVMLDLGVIDSTGRFVEPDKLSEKVRPEILSRIQRQNGQLSFCFAEAVNAGEQKIALTQKDVREFQLAKAAVRAGIKILQRQTGIEDSRIGRILLAGAFGNYIRPVSALRIGLLPNVSGDKIQFIGNAAGSGAQMILLSQLCRAKAKKLAKMIEYVEIAHQPGFLDVFTDSISF